MLTRFPFTLRARVLAAITAAVGASALLLQLVLIVKVNLADGHTVAFALWRFLGFFTILTNLMVALSSFFIATNINATITRPRARLASVTAILFVGLVYSVALRSTWNPQGWQAVADHGLHDATPPLFLLTWIFASHGTLRWRDVGYALIAPVAYCLYALLRGSLDGWYAYWFLDPARQTLFQLAKSILLLSAAFAVLAFVMIGVDRILGRRSSGR
jgi:hypothetical protein